MENVIVYLSQLPKSNELTEYFHNLGYDALLTDKRSSLITTYSQGIYTKVYLEISNFSDILLISSIKDINSDANIVLIVKPGLDDIISVLQDHNYQIINDLMNVSTSVHNL